MFGFKWKHIQKIKEKYIMEVMSIGESEMLLRRVLLNLFLLKTFLGEKYD